MTPKIDVFSIKNHPKTPIFRPLRGIYLLSNRSGFWLLSTVTDLRRAGHVIYFGIREHPVRGAQKRPRQQMRFTNQWTQQEKKEQPDGSGEFDQHSTFLSGLLSNLTAKLYAAEGRRCVTF